MRVEERAKDLLEALGLSWTNKRNVKLVINHLESYKQQVLTQDTLSRWDQA